MSHYTKLDENLEGSDNFWAWKYRIFLVLEENELDSYINEEVPVLEGDEAKGLHKKKLVMDQGSPHTIGVLPKDTKSYAWCPDQTIWNKEHKPKVDFEEPVKECEDPECKDHTVILTRVSQIKEQLEEV